MCKEICEWMFPHHLTSAPRGALKAPAVGSGVKPQPNTDFRHIWGQRKATWNTLFSIFEQLWCPSTIVRPVKPFPPSPSPLDGPGYTTTYFKVRIEVSRQTWKTGRTDHKLQTYTAVEICHVWRWQLILKPRQWHPCKHLLHYVTFDSCQPIKLTVSTIRDVFIKYETVSRKTWQKSYHWTYGHHFMDKLVRKNVVKDVQPDMRVKTMQKTCCAVHNHCQDLRRGRHNIIVDLIFYHHHCQYY